MTTTTLTPAEARMAATLLDLASDAFSNNTCNDLWMDDTPENRAMIASMQIHMDPSDTDVEEVAPQSDGRLITTDWCMMVYLSGRLKVQSQRSERAEIVAYIRDRARWLRAEVKHGGSLQLLAEVKVLDYLAGQVEKGRRAGSHAR